MGLVAGILGIIFKWKARNTMPINEKKKQMVKLGFAAMWTIILPVLYSHSRRKYMCYFTDYKTWLGEWCFSPYMVAVTIYMTGNAIELVLFFVPAISKYIETSNHRIFKTLSWWGQVLNSQKLHTFVLISHGMYCTVFSVSLVLLLVHFKLPLQITIRNTF